MTPEGDSAVSEREDSAALTRVHELVYELRVGDVMAGDVIAVTPDTSMTTLMDILRERRISGVPVVASGRLVGIASLEDLIKALRAGGQADPVADHMTTDVVTLRADELAVQAVKLFAQHGYGRLPVLDQAGTLVGIVTGSDITRGLLRELGRRYQAEEIRRYRASHIFQDIESDQTSLILRYHITPRDFERGGQASSKLKRALERLGANPALVRRIAVSAYEAEMNLVIHTTHGGELGVEVSPQRITLTTEDDGPGIADPEAAFAPGFTTAPDWVRELGFGAGMGLTNIKRYSDQVTIESAPGQGTRLVAVVEVPHANQA